MLIYYLTNFFIGSCLASHALVICSRFDRENYLLSRSHCDYCYHPLTFGDTIPIFSYLFLKGKCRYCKHEIDYSNLLFEVSGGWAFYQIDFNNINDWISAVFLFFLILIAIFDFREQEFPTYLLLPLFLLTVLKFHTPNLNSIIELFPVSLILGFLVFKNKLGNGDFYIYLLLAIFFNPNLTNKIFLLACLLIIILFLFDSTFKDKKELPFIPFILFSLAIIGI